MSRTRAVKMPLEQPELPELPELLADWIDKWYETLAQLPNDHERDVAFFKQTGEDIADLGFWDPVSHRPVHGPGCMCGIDTPSVFACGPWKAALMDTHSKTKSDGGTRNNIRRPA